MTVFLQIVGGCLVVLLCAAIALAAVAYFLDRLNAVWTRHDDELEALIVRRLGNSIVSCGWWFSEHVEVMNAIQMLGHELMKNGGNPERGIDQLRDEWRKKMAARKESEAQNAGS